MNGAGHPIGRRHKLQFLCALCAGWLLSGGWFVVHFVLTRLQKADADVINYTGRLRYYTQHVGLHIVAGELLTDKGGPGAWQANDTLHGTLRAIDDVCASLLGEPGAGEAGVPQIADAAVKASLRAWVAESLQPIQRVNSRIQDLRRSASATPGQIRAEVAAAVRLVNAATADVDRVVDLAGSAAGRRVQAVFVASVARAMCGFVWALVTACAFGKVWRPYVSMYNRLQEVEQQLNSLLRAAFDVVVPVSVSCPFKVLDRESTLSHMLGRPLEDSSMLACTQDAAEQTKMNALLLAEASGGQAGRQRSLLQAQQCWWNLFPQAPLSQLPVAPMVQCCWQYGPQGSAQQPMKVEIFAVSKLCHANGRRSTLLAARRIHAEGETQTGGESAGWQPAGIEAAPAGAEVAIDILGAGRIGDAFLAGRQQPASSEGQERSWHHSSSAETNLDALPQGANGSVSPHSELDNTPPPTLIGSGGVGMGRPDLRSPARDAREIAAQVSAALVEQLSMPRSGTRSGSCTPEMR